MDQTQVTASSLLLELETIVLILGATTYEWREINGAINILKNKNKAHYSKINKKLFLDFRMIADHQIDLPSLQGHIDKAFEFSDRFLQLKQ
jgi:hypothetical protein